jgi:SAM-dependent methyltransferase
VEDNEVNFGRGYSTIYDFVHKEKNYQSEAIQIANIITDTFGMNASTLDFGCGTGKHVSKLAELGLAVSGYDINSNMINIARLNFPGLDFYSDLNDVPKSFNFIYSLFDVLSYQTTDFEILDYLKQINSKSAIGGWVLLDGWHYPGLEQDPPRNRVRSFEFKGETLRREVVVLDKVDDNLTSLQIQIVKDADESVILEEIHSMRAFSAAEVSHFIHAVGGLDIQFFNGSDYAKPLRSNDWRFGVLFRI